MVLQQYITKGRNSGLFEIFPNQQQKLVKQILLPAEQISMGNAISISTDPQRLYLEVEPLPRIDLLQLRHPALQH